MSLVLNMVGGGSGGLKDGSAILSVTVPASSTVTATKGGVTLQPSLWLSGADASTEVALFAFLPSQFDNVNLWTIAATDGTNTASDTILITTNKEYELELSYSYWFIRNGVLLESFTLNSQQYITLTQEEGYVKFNEQYNVNALAYISADVTKYSEISITVLSNSMSGFFGQIPGIGLSSSTPSINGSGIVSPLSTYQSLNNSSGTIPPGTYTCDISSYSGQMIVWIALGGLNPGTINIYDFVLNA